MSSRRRTIRRLALGVAIAVGAAQLVPYGWWHQNPSVIDDTPWPSADSRSIARTSCYSCHSNETDWPVYSWIAPMSWLVRSDVEGGRRRLNFSDWDEAEGELDEAVEMIESGAMPPTKYTLIHRSAALTADERSTLIAALRELDDSGGGDGDDNSGRGNADDRRDDDRSDDNSGPGGG